MKLKTPVKIVGFLAALLLVLSLATPFVVKSQLKTWLLENGAQQASVERLYLNLWSGRLELEGLSATAEQQPALSLKALHADISYRELWNKRLQINRLLISGSQLSLQQSDKNWQIGPLIIPATEPQSEPEPQSPTEWRWGLSELALESLALAATLEGQQYRLAVESGQLRLLRNWLPDEDSFLQLKGSLNDSPFELDSQGTPLAANAAGQLKIRIDKLALAPLLNPWLPELKGTLDSDLNIRVQQQGKDLLLSQSGSLQLHSAEFNQQELSVKADSIGWSGKHEVTLGAAGVKSVHSDGNLRIRATALQQAELNLNGRSIDWQGNNKLSFSEGAPVTVITQGELQLQGLDISQPRLDLATESLGWNGSNEVKLADSAVAGLSNQGTLTVTELTLRQPEVSLREQQLNWKGSLLTDLTEKLTLKGEFSTAPSEMQLDQLQLSSAARSWQGAAELNIKEALLTALSGTLSLSGVKVADSAGTTLAALGKLSAGSLQAQADNHIVAGNLQISKIRLANKQPLLELDGISIDQLHTGAKHSRVGTVRLAAMKSELNLSKTGKPQAWINWLNKLSGAEESKKAQKPAPKSAAAPYAFAVKRVQLDQPALISFSDESVKARDITISIEKFAISDIDSQSDKPGPFELAAKINRFAKLQAEGKYSWMSAKPNGDWKGQLSNLELPPFSPYMQRYSGYQLQSGQFSLSSGGSVTQGQVDSKNKVNIGNLQVQQAPEGSKDEFNKQLGMPLETAISILTDDDNNVALDIPVKGSVDDPKFGYQSVINIIMAKVAKEGAISYLSAALQPYGALITLGRMVADSASKNAVDLEPVAFTPGSALLDKRADDYLVKISALLKKRDGIRLNLCGIATAADSKAITAAHRLKLQQLAASAASPSISASQASASLTPAIPALSKEALTAAMTSLAEERSAAVKKQLLEQGKVNPDRLFSCLPEVRAESELPPQVSMGL